MHRSRYILAAAISCISLSANAQTTDNQFIKTHPNLKINQIQIIGTHNSYAEPVDSNVLKLVDNYFSEKYSHYIEQLPPSARAKEQENHPNGFSFATALNYNHPNFDTQLDAGVRSLEIDVYNDPTGNRFNHPAAYEYIRKTSTQPLAKFDSLGLSKPGFKVLHVADIDVRSHYTTFKEALNAVKNWSNRHPNHLPIFLLIEVKNTVLPLFPNSSQVLPFDAKAFDDLDKEILATLGSDNIIKPSDIQGKYATLKEAVLHQNWPTLQEAKGKFVFLLEPSVADINQSPYIVNHPNLKDRVMFIQSEPNEDYAAFLLRDNALTREKEIQSEVQQGYMVRTRADIETEEARKADYARANKALSSGAQVVSTDFSIADTNRYKTNYQVQLPNKAKSAIINPINGK